MARPIAKGLGREMVLFPLVQFEFTSAIGPEPGRYRVASDVMARACLEPARGPRAGGDDSDVLVISVVGAPVAWNTVIRRRARTADRAGVPKQVPIAVATVVFASLWLPAGAEATEWLSEIRSSRDSQFKMIRRAEAIINLAVRAHRAAAADPYITEITAVDARAVRIGFGTGEETANGRFSDAFLVTPPPAVRWEERVKPSEAVSSVLMGRTPLLEGEELLLRLMLDLDRGRRRLAGACAALTLDILLAELVSRGVSQAEVEQLRTLRPAVAAISKRAQSGELDDAAVEQLVAFARAAARACSLARSTGAPRNGDEANQPARSTQPESSYSLDE